MHFDSLRIENETLREEVRQLREQLGLDASAEFSARCSVVFALRRSEAAMFKVLLSRPVASSELLLAALPKRLGRDELTMSNVAVHVCRMRPRLAPHGLSIKTIFGFGFCMDAADRARAAAMLAGVLENAA